MDRQDTSVALLLARIKRNRHRILRKSDVLAWGSDIADPERTMACLEATGFVDKIDDGLWLVPSGERPTFERSRWGNRSLKDPAVISTLVVCKPTLRDITKLLLAYGRRTVDQALVRAKGSGAISEAVEATAQRMIRNAWTGIGNAVRRQEHPEAGPASVSP